MKSGDHPHVIAVPPLIYLGFVLLGLLLGYIWPAPIGWGPVRLAAAGGFLVVGLALGAAAIRQFRLAGTNLEVDKPATSLVTSGPFRFSRNPIYLSLSLLMVGVGFLANNFWILLILVPTLIVMHFGVITREEQYLEAKFGAEYLRYKSSVRRWF